MNFISAILMGILQGVAEFLPISSSGHLALFQRFFGMEDFEETQMFFTVLLHFGTLISVFIVYWRDIVDMIWEFCLAVAGLVRRDEGGTPPPPARRMVMLIVVATLPLFVMIFFKDAIETLFSNSLMVSCALIVTGFILFFSDRIARGSYLAQSPQFYKQMAMAEKTQKTPPWWTPSLWGRARRWPLSPACPARAPLSRWG